MDISERRNHEIKFFNTKIRTFQYYKLIFFGISKPRHLFVYIINDANINSQTANPFFYNTFSVSTDTRTLINCHLVVNGNGYPELHYTPS